MFETLAVGREAAAEQHPGCRAQTIALPPQSQLLRSEPSLPRTVTTGHRLSARLFSGLVLASLIPQPAYPRMDAGIGRAWLLILVATHARG